MVGNLGVLFVLWVIACFNWLNCWDRSDRCFTNALEDSNEQVAGVLIIKMGVKCCEM